MCLTIPVRPGRRDELVEFMRDVDGPRRAEFGEMERRIGVTREVFFLSRGGHPTESRSRRACRRTFHTCRGQKLRSPL